MNDGTNTAPPTREEVEKRLDALRAKRGYLLPHHGLLAVAAPALLEAYDATYTALTLDPRYLSERAREFVWLAILVSTREAIATHHIRRLRDGGGGDSDLELALRLAAYAEGGTAFTFVAEHWAPHLPNYDAERAYRTGIEAIVGGSDVPAGWVEMALAAIHTCHRRWWHVEVHIQAAYGAGVAEPELAEALTLTMFPGGVPNFVDACACWRKLILAGAVEASPPYRAWAEAPGQGGYDEASGKEDS